jgi:hypothetical protein
MGYNGPFFYYQLGHQDQTVARDFLQDSIGQGVILSPRHLKVNKLENYIADFQSANAEICIDPQLYNPRFEHKEGYNFGDAIDSTIAIEKSDVQEVMVNGSLNFQLARGVSKYIIPSPYTNQLTSGWMQVVSSVVDYAKKWRRDNHQELDLLLTISIAAPILESDETRVDLLNFLTSLEVTGFYIVIGRTGETVAPANSAFLTGLMDLVFRLKQNQYTIIHGFTSYYAILLFPLGLDGFATGGFKNRRLFDIEDWYESESTGFQQARGTAFGAFTC